MFSQLSDVSRLYNEYEKKNNGFRRSKLGTQNELWRAYLHISKLISTH